VIKSLPAIVARHPEVVYLVLGATHPHLVAREGESYRLSLVRLAEECALKEHVIFYNRFVSQEDLAEFIGATDIYLTPYPNEAQITSGTLAQVFGAGKAVVSTPYWHARELLADGRGILVPFQNPQAIADGVCAYLDDPKLLESTRITAYQAGREMIWPAVGRLYLESFQRARADRKAAPRNYFGGWALGIRPYNLPPLRLDHMASRYLAFLAAALEPQTARFRNFMSHQRQWKDEIPSEDSHARALWALGVGAGRSRNHGHQRLAVHLFELALPTVEGFRSPRAWAFALLGIHEYLRQDPDKQEVLASRELLTAKLLDLWNRCATQDWPWFETSVTYDNARLSQALVLSGQGMADEAMLRIGIDSLRWLASIQKTQPGHFRPIGSNGFHVKDGAHADFDQQPVEAQAMVSACLDAFRVTGDEFWTGEAKRAFEWFLGRNDLGQALYDPTGGGCGDGLHPDRVNANQGAESSLAFQIALAEMTHAAHPIPHSHIFHP